MKIKTLTYQGIHNFSDSPTVDLASDSLVEGDFLPQGSDRLTVFFWTVFCRNNDGQRLESKPWTDYFPLVVQRLRLLPPAYADCLEECELVMFYDPQSAVLLTHHLLYRGRHSSLHNSTFLANSHGNHKGFGWWRMWTVHTSLKKKNVKMSKYCVSYLIKIPVQFIF